jgi:hypothetical protein
MIVLLSQEDRGSIPNNGMYVRRNNGGSAGSQEGSWKMVFDDEARKINPLFDVKIKRNELILNAIQNNDWKDYNRFQAKQHPAWYEHVDGEFQPNKVYYGSLIESKINALKEAKAAGNDEEVQVWEKSLQEAIADFNKAPGIVPYVVGLNHTADLAEEHGVSQPGEEYFDSRWNSSLVSSQGKFEQNMWYDNAYFADNPEVKQHVEDLVADTFPVSGDNQQSIKQAGLSEEASGVSADESSSLAEPGLGAAFLQNSVKMMQSYKPSYKIVEELYR